MSFHTSSEIYHILKQEILNIEQIPGQRLSESELAKTFRVSRTPVHDALSQLKAENLVVRYPQRGTLVSLLDWDLIQQIIYMRTQLDIAVFSSIVFHWKPEYEAAIKQNLEQQRQIVLGNQTSDSANEFYKLSNGFHAIFYSVLNKQRLWDEIVTQQYDYIRYRKLLFTDQTIVKNMYHEHEIIFNLVCDKNIPALNRFIFQHNAEEGESFPQELTQYCSYFKDDELAEKYSKEDLA